MNKYILIFLLVYSTASAQNNCCYPSSAGTDTTICGGSLMLHPKIGSAIISCTTIGNPQTQNEIDETGYTINGSQSSGEYAACGIGGAKLMIAIIDSACLTAWSNNNINFGQLNQYPVGNCRARPENDFQFNFADSNEMASAANMLVNIVPNNDFILVYSYIYYDYSSVASTLKSAFGNLGFPAFDTLVNAPFIFFVQKGNPGTAQQVIGINAEDTIHLNATVNTSHNLHNLMFSWSPGNTLNDSTLQSPVATPGDTTIYIMTVTDTLNQCTAIDSVTVFYTCPTGINENKFLNDVTVFPNPVIDEDEITFNYSVSSQQGIITIYNAEGKEVTQYRLPQWSSVQRLKLPWLASGIYLARLTQGDAVGSVKFIKE